MRLAVTLAVVASIAAACAPPARDAEPTQNTKQAGSIPPPGVTLGADQLCTWEYQKAGFCWGSNQSGDLGIGTETPAYSPTLIAGGPEAGWTSLSASQSNVFTCGTKVDGTLWCWGNDSSGQLGQGTTSTTPATSPVQVGTGTSWSRVSVGDSFACATRYDGTLWCWGDNAAGELGLGYTSDPIAAPTQVPGGQTWGAFATGVDYVCAIATGGSLYCWGDDASGQLGNGTTSPFTPFPSPQKIWSSTAWTSISAGGDATCGIQGGNGPYDGGTLWCWGAGMFGSQSSITTSPQQVGTATDWTYVAPTTGLACGIQSTPSTFVLSLWCWGHNEWGQLGLGYQSPSGTWVPPTQVPQSASWNTVAVNGARTCATAWDESVWCWGYGPLGNGTTSTPSTTPVHPWYWNELAAFGSSTCATHTDGSLWCWGDNTYGQAAQGATSTTPIEAPAHVGTQTWAGVSASPNGYHGCAVRSDGTLWCWGYNGWGQLGNGTHTTAAAPVQVNGASGWNMVSAGYSHTCGIWENTLWCWGDNSQGQLGTGNTTSSNYTVQIGTEHWQQVSAGAFTTCAIRSDSTLWCWGYNATGAVGQGTTATNYTSPTQVGSAATWAAVHVGTYYACATRFDGSLWCWGANDSGQLGTGDFTKRTSPTQIAAGSTWYSVSPGYKTTCAVANAGGLWCWGSNANGIAGQGNTTTTTYASPTQVGALTGWMTAAVGADHACASDGVAYCWGNDVSGQLGIGSTTAESSPTEVQ